MAYRSSVLSGVAAVPLFVGGQAAAQAVCSQSAGGQVDCVENGSVTATGQATPGSVIPGEGLLGSSGADLSGTIVGDIRTLSAGAGAVSLTAGGNIDYRQDGNLETFGGGSAGLLAGADGDVTVSVGNVSTEAADANGVRVTAGLSFFDTFSRASVQCGNVSTTGANANAVSVFASSSATLACGDVSATGAGSDGVSVATETGAINLGNVIANHAGVSVSTLDFGDIDLKVLDVQVTGDGGSGIVLNTHDGAIHLDCRSIATSGGNSVGLRTYGSDGRVFATCGDISTQGDGSAGADLNETMFSLGNITTRGNDADGLRSYSFGGTIGTVGNIVTTGNNSNGVNVADTILTTGDVTTSGDNSVGVLVSGYQFITLATGQVTTTGVQSHGINIHPSTTDMVYDLRLGGVHVSGDGADGIRIAADALPGSSFATNLAPQILGNIVSEQGTAILVGDASTFSLALEAGRQVSGLTGGIISNAGATTLDIAGAVASAEGPAIQAFGGPVHVSVAETGSVTGQLNFGDGEDRVDNAGQISISRDSDFGGGSDLFANTGQLNTSGNVTLAHLEAFQNAGGTVSLQNGVAGDRLRLTGDYSGGTGAAVLLDISRSLDVADVLAVDGTISGNTVLSINWLDSNAPVNAAGVRLVEGSADAHAFTIQGLGDYGLFAPVVRARDDGLYIVAALDPAATDLAVIGRAGSDMWFQSFDALRASISGRGSFFPKLGVWGQAYGGSDRSGGQRHVELFGADTPISTRLDTDRLGGQLGLDASAGPALVGATAGYERARSDAGGSSRLSASGWNIGAYATVGAAVGPYAVLTLKHDRYGVRFHNATIAAPKLDGRSSGADVELGWRTALLPASLDLELGMSLVQSKLDGFEIDGTRFDTDDETRVRGRAGVRASLAGPLHLFAEGQLFHQFSGSDVLRISNGDEGERINLGRRGTSGRLSVGLGGGRKAPLLSGWVDVGAIHGWGLRAGMAF
ncbi:hypothetical protein ACUXST_002205 [Sphingomonas sp. F9_3S_D5_B_2]